MSPSFLILILTWAPTGTGSLRVSWTLSVIDSPVATTMGKGSTEAVSRVPGSADPSEKKESNIFLGKSPPTHHRIQTPADQS